MHTGQARREQQAYDEADEHRREHGQRYRPADQAHAPFEHVDLAQPTIMIGAATLQEQRLQQAGAIDDPGQTVRADVEEGSDPAEQEDGRNRDPHHFGDGGYRKVGAGLKHPLAMHHRRPGGYASAFSRSQLATSRSNSPLTTKLAARIHAKLAISGVVGPNRLTTIVVTD